MARRIPSKDSYAGSTPVPASKLWDAVFLALAHLALTAFLALSLRRSALSFLARASPPFFPSATAWGFFMPSSYT